MFFIDYLILIIPILLSVAFLTLLERKELGSSQYRKGPNKVSLWGFLQPIADAVKLFFKENFSPSYSNWSIFFISPMLSLTLILILWLSFPIYEKSNLMNSFWMIFMIILGLGIYPLYLSGWSSNSIYAYIGALRSIAQTISYELSLALIIFNLIYMFKKLNLYFMPTFSNIQLFMFLIPLMILWLISCVAETNRTPFDFAEGESELVSGFNIEYSSGNFVLIFLAEYASIFFLSCVTANIFFNFNFFLFLSSSIFISFIWIWLRSTFPRYRYDLLMNLAWKHILPNSLLILSYYMLIL